MESRYSLQNESKFIVNHSLELISKGRTIHPNKLVQLTRRNNNENTYRFQLSPFKFCYVKFYSIGLPLLCRLAYSYHFATTNQKRTFTVHLNEFIIYLFLQYYYYCSKATVLVKTIKKTIELYTYA